ncbi:hypothetical protein PT229_01495 [Erysipelothrix rhusiopathiae]|nr:hypothetical protein [Erysipelothrix rhusiopathiae]MDE8165428.1 hypothetical protein [Erysipelothrix rhusiopathiae]MDE8333996.1 hypothetical protein [Erysipelothrix rhusiopathiae]
MNYLLDFLTLIISSLITFYLLKYEFRKSRELDIYYQTFETLVSTVPQIENLCSSLQLVFLELYETNKQLLNNQFGDYIIVRPLGENLDCLEYYKDIYDEVSDIIRELDSLTRKLSYLSTNFKDQSVSRQLLIRISQDPKSFIDNRYGSVLDSLSFVKHHSTIFPEHFTHIFPKEKRLVEGVEIEFINLVDYTFKIDDVEEIISHFNRNNFK